MDKHRLGIALAFSLIFTFTSCSEDKSKVSIKGTIQQQEHFDLSKSELKLIRLSPGDKLQVGHVEFKFDQGSLESINYPSGYPAKPLDSAGRFAYQVDKILPGKYVLAVHKLKPTYQVQSSLSNPSPPRYFSRVLKTPTDQYIVIEVGQEILPPTKIILADVVVPLEQPDNPIIGQFPNPQILKY